MKIGFSGTQVGMTGDQAATFGRLLLDHRAPVDRAAECPFNRFGLDCGEERCFCKIPPSINELHHGDCIGADAQADELARLIGLTVVIHPPSDPKKRAFKAQSSDTVWEPLPYLKRNRDIVDSCEVLVAAPKGYREEVRSGTWSTIRYAQKQSKPVTIIWPDGSTEQGGIK